MSLWIQKTFIDRISYNLPRFTWISPNVGRFRCILCGDSKKSSTKARAFFVAKKDNFMFICHNGCCAPHPFKVFLKNYDYGLFQEYKIAELKESGNYKEPEKSVHDLINELENKKPTFNPLLRLTPLRQLPNDSLAKKYLIDRKIPLKYCYYTNKYFSWANSFQPGKYPPNGTEQERIIIPWFDTDGSFSGYSARAINGEQPKYYTYKVHDDALFGMDTIDLSKKVYVVEGQIDSIFIDNCIAAASSALDSTCIPKENAVLIPDKDVRNKEIMKLVDKWIKNGYTVCLLNEQFPYKDINDAIISGMSKENLMAIIEENTFSGLKAKMVFANWSKV